MGVVSSMESRMAGVSSKVGNSSPFTVGESYLVRMVSGVFIAGKFVQETEDCYHMVDCLELMIGGTSEGVQAMFAPVLLLNGDTTKRGVDLVLWKQNIFSVPYKMREDIETQYTGIITGLSLGKGKPRILVPQ